MTCALRCCQKLRATRFPLILLFLLVLSPSMFARVAVQPTASLSEEEYRKRDLEIKNRAVEVEEKKVLASALGTGVPILAGMIALAGTIIAARKTYVANFTAKAAELALQGEKTTFDVINRAKLLAKLYKDLLPKDFAGRVEELQADEVGRIVAQAPWSSELQKEVIELLAQHPEQRQQIIADYKSMFGYPFLEKLATIAPGSADANAQPKKPSPDRKG